MGEKYYTGYPEGFVLTFGKNRGKQLGQILADDPTYIDWLVGQKDQQWFSKMKDVHKAIDQMASKYSAEIQKAVDEKDKD